jgi:hypothetical protein
MKRTSQADGGSRLGMWWGACYYARDEHGKKGHHGSYRCVPRIA